MTTRVCHSKTIVRAGTPSPPRRRRRLRARHPRPRHDPRLCAAGAPAAAREAGRASPSGTRPKGRIRAFDGDRSLGIITSGVAFHARARGRAGGRVPQARHDLSAAARPHPRLRRQRRALRRASKKATPTWWMPFAPRASPVEGKPEMYRFGELNVARVRRILAGDVYARARAARRQAARAVRRLPASQVFDRAARPGLHRGRRYRLLLARRAAAVSGHGHAACAWARRIGVGLGHAPRAARRPRRGGWSA